MPRGAQTRLYNLEGWEGGAGRRGLKTEGTRKTGIASCWKHAEANSIVKQFPLQLKINKTGVGCGEGHEKFPAAGQGEPAWRRETGEHPGFKSWLCLLNASTSLSPCVLTYKAGIVIKTYLAGLSEDQVC